MNKQLKTKLIFAAVLILLIVFYLSFGRIFIPQKSGISKESVELKIKRGSSLKAIADSLQEKGIINDGQDFVYACKLFRKMNKVKAGRYQISPGLSIYHVMNILVNGKTSNILVTIPEGYTSFQIASLLQKKVEIDSIKFIELTHDALLIKEAGIQANSLEGYLFPNTYNFYWGISEREIIKSLLREFYHNFSDSLKNIVTEKGWTVHQIVTLASLIEGEVVVDSERTIVSAIYHNRLKKKMLLQACPTIQYIILDGPRRLLNKDLKINSPYNTYVHAGLPPGPVNNPGRESILAAINPADVDYLFLVARGDGSHIFSKNLNQHLRAKSKFDEFRRELNRKERQHEAK